MKTVDEYVLGFAPEVSTELVKLRELIKSEAPDAEEGMSYGIPAYKLCGHPLVYFAGYKGHIGLYATPSGHAAFAEELAGYKQGKGSVQFPVGKPLPYELIARIVRFRIEENRMLYKKC